MAVLESYGKEIHSVFQLLGEKENDITLSMSWVLARCPEFLKGIIEEVAAVLPDADETYIMNQRYDKDTGITDIEVTDHKKFHVIFEAKRGWLLPGSDQLTRYSLRDDFVKSKATTKVIVSLSECTKAYANAYLPFLQVNGVPIVHLPYRDVYRIALDALPTSNHEQKHLLTQFGDYLKGMMTMQKADSNMVYVVSLGHGTPEDCALSWIDIVKTAGRYFHPIGGKGGWPTEPPNYIAFRYDGQLQSIHHIEAYTVSTNLHNEIPQMPDVTESINYFVYTLGPEILPGKIVKTGKIFPNGRVWAMLDTLLTCDTISEARDLTQSRL